MKKLLALGAALCLAACATTGAVVTPAMSDGAWVLAQWEDGFYYPGVLARQSGGRYTVAFDDGAKATVGADQIRPCDWQPGAVISCQIVEGRMEAVTVSTLGPGATDLGVTDEAGARYDTTTARCRALN